MNDNDGGRYTMQAELDLTRLVELREAVENSSMGWSEEYADAFCNRAIESNMVSLKTAILQSMKKICADRRAERERVERERAERERERAERERERVERERAARERAAAAECGGGTAANSRGRNSESSDNQGGQQDRDDENVDIGQLFLNFLRSRREEGRATADSPYGFDVPQQAEGAAASLGEILQMLRIFALIAAMGDDDDVKEATEADKMDETKALRAVTVLPHGHKVFVDENGCAVCLNAFAASDSVVLAPCGHGIHRSCYDGRKVLYTECYMCRASIAAADVLEIPYSALPALAPDGAPQ